MNAPGYNDAVNTRFVFKAYAVVAWVAGTLLYGWGPAFFPTPLFGGLAFSGFIPVRVAGAVLGGIGFMAMAVARSQDDDARRSALGWWALGHAVILAGLALQLLAIIGEESVSWGGWMAMAFLAVVCTIFAHLWQTADGIPWGGLGLYRSASLLEQVRGPSVRPHRSVYEQKIRETAGQEERHRLARDLHDSIKQQIFAMHTAAATAQARFDSDPAGAKVAVEQVRSSAREAMTEMEAMLDQLRASPLENNGLVEALKKQCEALRFRTGADVQFTLGELPPSETLPPGTHQGLLRIAQEALANVGRHARATHVTVTFDSTPVSVQLRVDDDGVGFDTGQQATGMGLGNIRSRADALGGKLTLTSHPGEGTLVRVAIPHTVPSVSDLAVYRRRALFWGVGCVSAVLLVIWAANRPPQERLALVIWSTSLAFAGVGFARVTAAYLRARRAAASVPGSGSAA